MPEDSCPWKVLNSKIQNTDSFSLTGLYPCEEDRAGKYNHSPIGKEEFLSLKLERRIPNPGQRTQKEGNVVSPWSSLKLPGQ